MSPRGDSANLITVRPLTPRSSFPDKATLVRPSASRL